jgi:hypothetical protein
VGALLSDCCLALESSLTWAMNYLMRSWLALFWAVTLVRVSTIWIGLSSFFAVILDSSLSDF